MIPFDNSSENSNTEDDFEDIKNDNDNKKKNNNNIICSKNKEKDNYIFNDIDNLKKYLNEYSKDFDEKFELLDKISSGSSGVVYRGQLRNNKNLKQYAFKFLYNNNKKKKYGKNSKEKNEKECNNNNEYITHMPLKNKHIISLYGCYKIQDHSCIFMEYAQNGNLVNLKNEILQKSSLSKSLLLYIAGGILEALHYIHVNNKIIHMNIKQENVLLDDYLNVKLTNFSVSINYKNKTLKDTIPLPMAGTCYYMSPEVLGQKCIIASEASKIDIYSLGVLLYYLAFNDYPYQLKDVNSKDHAQIVKNILEHDLEFPKETKHSSLFLNFLKKCLNKDIKQRYDICEAMNDSWIKGYQIIIDEKEKINDNSKFLNDLKDDNLKNFNEYLKKNE